MTRLDEIRAKGWTSHLLMLRAKQTGDVLLAAEADAQAVVERLRKGPVRLLPQEDVITAAEAARVLTQAFAQYRRVAR